MRSHAAGAERRRDERDIEHPDHGPRATQPTAGGGLRRADARAVARGPRARGPGRRPGPAARPALPRPRPRARARIRCRVRPCQPGSEMSKTIVFVHGGWVTPACWEPFASYFEAKGYRCIVSAWPGKDLPIGRAPGGARVQGAVV